MHVSTRRLALRLLAITLLACALLGIAPGAARAAGPPPAGPWAWPLEPVPAAVVRPFDRPAGPYAGGHRGVDLAARVGQSVLAAGDGVVVFAGTVAGRPVVSIDHPGGLRTTYEPVEPLVQAGEPVTRGQPLGTVTAAAGHCLPGTCLHWGVRVGEAYRDPLTLLGVVEVRLLPLWSPVPVALPGAPAGADQILRSAGDPDGTDRPPDRGPLLARS